MPPKPPSLHSIFLRMLMFKLFMPSLLLGFILVGVSTYYNITVIQHDQYILVKFLTSQINNFLSDATRTIQAIADTSNVIDQRSIGQQLTTTFNSDPYFHSLMALDEDKKVLAFYPPDAFPVASIVNRLPIFDHPPADSSSISQPFYSSLPGKPTAFITAHLDQGGWLVGEILFDEVERIITERPAPTPGRSVFLTDLQGEVLIGSDPSAQQTRQSISHIEILSNLNENSSISTFGGQIVLSNIENLANAGWQIQVYFPVINAIGNFILAAAALIGILLILWLLVLIDMRRDFTRRVYNPLAQFNQYIQSISKGHPAERTRPLHFPSPFIEIKNISESFEEMSVAINQRQQALQEDEQKYRLLIEQSGDAIYLEQDGQFVVINKKFNALFGDFNEPLGLSNGIHQLAAPSDLVFVQEQQMRMLNGEVDSLRFEFKALNRDHQEIDVEVSTSAFLYRNRLAIQGIIRDISERKRIEQSEREQRNLSEALRDTASVLTSTLNLNEVIDRILNNIGKVVPCDALNIMLIDESTGQAKVIASKGYEDWGIADWLMTISLSVQEYPDLAWMYDSRQPIVIPDTHQHKEWSAFDQTRWISSYAGAPIMVQGKVIGFINLDSPEVNFFSLDQAERLKTFANQAGIAIHNAQLLQELSTSNFELTAAYETTLQGWSKALELRDYETQGHTLRVLDLTIRLAKRMGITEPQITHMRYGVLLHDIGKICISDNILFKKGPLTSYEWETMRKHPSFAFEMLSPINYLQNAIDIPYCHHEWWDGTGYPRGLKGESIPLAARLFSVVDVWDALTSERPYHHSLPVKQVIAHLLEQSGKQLDPDVVKAFIEMILEENHEQNPKE